MRYNRLRCPKCAVVQKHTRFVRQMTDPNIDLNDPFDRPYYVDTDDAPTKPMLFRLACVRCGFAGYTVDWLDNRKLAKAWNDAVIDYERGQYVGPNRVFFWLNIKQTYHTKKKKGAKRNEQTDLLS